MRTRDSGCAALSLHARVLAARPRLGPACLLATFRPCASVGPGAPRCALLTAGTSARDDLLRCGGCDVLTRVVANAARRVPESPPSVVSGYW